ncbi:MAG: hypothetical protein KDC46_11790, partial [Thermoleophilia bacterium]|nr:hypothetical protein [Thermoleophilia bacterium]
TLTVVGRKILLGRLWKGAAEIERVAPWWHRNGAHSIQQAADGVSWRSAPDVVRAESQAAARRIAATLPAAADPFRASKVFARHLAAAGQGGVAAIDDAAAGAHAVVHASLGDAAPTVATTIPLRKSAGRSLQVKVAWDGASLTASELVPLRDWRSRGLREALDAAWRELGIDRVRSERTGIARSISNIGS